MAELLKGAAVATALTEKLSARVAELKQAGVVPTLAIVRVGENGGDMSYERGAMKRCEKVGIEVRHFVLPIDCTEAELVSVIEQVNADDSVHGVLMFRPLPKHIDERRVCSLLKPEKDVDCITSQALCGVFTGAGVGYAPCTAESVIEMLDYYKLELTGKNVAVIGRSLVIGKPVSMMLQKRNATVTMCHTKTVNMARICRDKDILVVAAGHAGTVTADFAAPNQVVIDVGINVDENGKLCGDVAFDEVEPIVSAISPVPGGVGSVTTAVLCKHVVLAAEKCVK